MINLITADLTNFMQEYGLNLLLVGSEDELSKLYLIGKMLSPFNQIATSLE